MSGTFEITLFQLSSITFWDFLGSFLDQGTFINHFLVFGRTLKDLDHSLFWDRGTLSDDKHRFLDRDFLLFAKAPLSKKLKIKIDNLSKTTLTLYKNLQNHGNHSLKNYIPNSLTK